MENPELNRLLDTILEILRERVKNAPGIKSYLKDRYYIISSDDEVSSALDQLKKDGYITIDQDGVGRCRITTKGKDFFGYQNQQDFTVSENIRMGKLETDQSMSRNLLNFLTKLIAAGTLVMASYYVIEIYKELHSFFHRHELYWIWETIPKKRP